MDTVIAVVYLGGISSDSNSGSHTKCDCFSKTGGI